VVEDSIGPGEVAVDEEIADTSGRKPHVLLLGAGASKGNLMLECLAGAPSAQALPIIPVPEIPGNPYRGSDAPSRAYEHLQAYHGVSPGTASDRLHRIKQRSGVSPTTSVVIGRTGDVYHEMTGEHLGSLTDPAA